MTSSRSLFALPAAALALLLTGCGAGNFHPATTVATPAVPLTGHAIPGKVMGGQQPVAGATIQVFPAATTGYAAATTPLTLANGATSTTTGSDGSFDTGTITCTSGTYLYILSTGGDPTPGTPNNGATLFAGLGLCDNVNSIASVVINEVTTVTSAYALGAFMTGPTNLGTSANNIKGLGLAFADINALVNIVHGTAGGPSLPSTATLPTAEINTLANALANCVNSATGSGACTSFYTAAQGKAANAPTDTLTAALNIVRYPAAVDVATLYTSGMPTSPFQPTLQAQPNDFTLAVNYAPAGLVNPSAIAFDSTGIPYLTDKGAGTVVKLGHDGSVTATNATSGAAFTSATIDGSDGVFATNYQTTGSTIRHYNSNFSTTYNQVTTGYNGPTDSAIDQNGLVWITYSVSNALTVSNAAVTTFTPYTGAGITYPLGIAISTK